MGLSDWFEQQSSSVQVLIILGVIVLGFFALVLTVVIGAAIIGSFVLSSSPPPVDTPTANFDVEANNSAGTLTVTHVGGDTISAGNTSVQVGSVAEYPWTEPDGTISAGDSVTIQSDSIDAGETVRVVWSNPDTVETIYQTTLN